MILARRVLVGAVCSALALAAAPAPAQDGESDWKFKWDNGFKLDSPDKSLQLKFGGRVQADYTFASVDAELGVVEDGFEFRRARLFFEGKVYERIAFKSEYDFAGGDADFKDVYIGLLNEWGDVRFGHFKEPFSLEEQTSSKYVTFLERSLPVEAFSPSRNAGVGVSGGNDLLTWGVGAFYDADDFGESVSEDDTNLTARVVFRPLYEDGGARLLHVGVAGAIQERGDTMRFRARPEAHLAPRFVDTGSLGADGATLLAGEVAAVVGPFWGAAEYMRSDVDATTAGDPTFDGFYAAAGWFLTGEKRSYKASSGAWDRIKPTTIFGQEGGRGAWEVAARYSSLDLSDAGVAGGEQDDLTLALNWYLNPVTRLMMNWVRADVDGSGEGDFFLLRWQVDF